MSAAGPVRGVDHHRAIAREGGLGCVRRVRCQAAEPRPQRRERPSTDRSRPLASKQRGKRDDQGGGAGSGDEPEPPCPRRRGRRFSRRPGVRDVIQRVPDVRDVAKPLAAVLVQAALEQPLDSGRGRGGQRGPVRLALQDGGDGIRHRLAGKCRFAGQHFVEHAPERPDIRALVEGLSACLFRAHVCGRTKDYAHGSQRRARHRSDGGATRVRSDVRLERLREAEVEHLDGAILPELDVGGLQIPVHDPFLVSGIERVDDLAADGQDVSHRHRAINQPIGERGTFDELEHERRDTGALLDAVDGADVGMIERGQQLRLALEPRETIGGVYPGALQHLERDLTLEARVACAVDLTHSARAERGKRLVRSEPGSRGQSHRWYLRRPE